ncbi:Hypothetical predicted protein [Paramuricea clavata]|uniref:Uncharacterized protein n=1 Tax=Paramuricea clavata TaxID=317549 RepID=A0A6S7GD21_PARCT|nr:Hypothetical predicted protein [Paramuricea clavata]
MVDVPYQAARLRKRIQKRYPQIVFHSSKTMNKGTLVYVDSMSAGDVVDDLIEIHTESDTEDEDIDEGDDELNDDSECSKEERINSNKRTLTGNRTLRFSNCFMPPWRLEIS